MSEENQSATLPPLPPERQRKLLFSPGNVFATPAVLRHLHAHNISSTWLLAMHCSGLWGDLDDEDAQANTAAVKSGARILSAYDLAGERIWVITDAVDGLRRRHTTTLLKPEEY
jgi:hypothetical protein